MDNRLLKDLEIVKDEEALNLLRAVANKYSLADIKRVLDEIICFEQYRADQINRIMMILLGDSYMFQEVKKRMSVDRELNDNQAC